MNRKRPSKNSIHAKDKPKKEKKIKKKTLELFEQIGQNYADLNKMMEREVALTSGHGTLTGSHREHMWYKFFRSIIPLKYSMAQGVMIIDSERGVSKEVDIAVYDEQYTPYVFQYNTLKFIPIEAVSVVIECKSQTATPKKLKAWAYSIRRLKPKQTGLARIVNGYATGLTNSTQSRTRPIFILAAHSTKVSQNVRSELGDFFDFILCRDSANSGFQLYTHYEKCSLGWWAEQLNQAQDIERKEKPKHESSENEQVETERSNKKKNPEYDYIFPESQLKISEKQKQMIVSSQGLTLEKAEKYCENITELKLSCGYKYKEQIPNDREPGNETNKESEKLLSHFILQDTLSNLKVEANPLLSLNFQLNQLLTLINNPMFFPHFAYAKSFESLNK
jgi:hypothetical protein